MSAFIKYRSLENHYNTKMVSFLNGDDLVTVSEKIDGSNISICVSPTGDWHFASRNQQVAGQWNNIEQFIEPALIDRLVAYSKTHNVQTNLFGEIFSSTILRRIAYGLPQVLFFDLALNGEYVTGEQFEQFSKELNIPVVPTTIMTLQEALELNVENLKSAFVKQETKSFAEGIVIKPYKTNEFNNKVPAIKKKAEAFLEKAKQKIDRKGEVVSDDEINYLALLNENRMLSYISKHGEMTEMSQMGDYIKGIMMDAKEEFLKDMTVDDIANLDQSIFKKGGQMVSKMLVNRMKGI